MKHYTYVVNYLGYSLKFACAFLYYLRSALATHGRPSQRASSCWANVFYCDHEVWPM